MNPGTPLEAFLKQARTKGVKKVGVFLPPNQFGSSKSFPFLGVKQKRANVATDEDGVTAASFQARQAQLEGKSQTSSLYRVAAQKQGIRKSRGIGGIQANPNSKGGGFA